MAVRAVARIPVVDDDLLVRDTIKRILPLEGHERGARTTYSGVACPAAAGGPSGFPRYVPAFTLL
jgi:hypothetical protein